MEKAVGDEVREAMWAQSCRALKATVGTLAVLSEMGAIGWF